MEDNITVTITGEGISLTKKTNLQKAGQIISFLGVEQNASVSTAYESKASSHLLVPKPIQPKEIIVNSSAKTYPQKIAALGVYLRDQVGQETFSPQDMKVIFKKMGDEPKNFTRDLKSAMELQYVICTDPASEQYELTDKGSEAVTDNFSSKAIKKSVGSKRSVVSSGVREEVRQFEMVGMLENFPEYHTLATKGDKILWLLAFADKKGVNALTPTEVDFMSGELRDKVDAKGFTALNQRNIKNVFVSKTATGFQIQKKGSDHLKSLQS
ncbi:MAG: hypothetical protein V4509_04010 [Patescibacteria group bacterium]